MIFGKASVCLLIKMTTLAKNANVHSELYQFFLDKSSEIYMLAVHAFYVRPDDMLYFKESFQNYLIDLEDIAGKHVTENKLDYRKP